MASGREKNLMRLPDKMTGMTKKYIFVAIVEGLTDSSKNQTKKFQSRSKKRKRKDKSPFSEGC